MSHFCLNLFIASILIAPGSSTLRIITFSLCMIANYKKIQYSFERFSIFILFFLMLFLSVTGMLFRDISYDINFIVMYILNFLMLGIFFLDPRKINIMPGINIASVFIILSTFLYLYVAYVHPEFGASIFSNLKTMFLFQPHIRNILYWNIYSVFHLASPILVFMLALMWYKYLVMKYVKYAIYTFAIFACLVFSGTRANIFSAMLIILLIYLHYVFFIKKRMLQTIVWLFLAGSVFFVGSYLFLSRLDASSIAKAGHISSYLNLFNNNITYFFIGQGVGSYFYTSGFNMAVTLTELSYIELIRMFGIFFTIIIVFLYLLPFLKQKKYNLPDSFSIAIAYLAYLFIAGTNPFLIGRTGFMAMWIAYILLIRIKKHKLI